MFLYLLIFGNDKGWDIFVVAAFQKKKRIVHHVHGKYYWCGNMPVHCPKKKPSWHTCSPTFFANLGTGSSSKSVDEKKKAKPPGPQKLISLCRGFLFKFGNSEIQRFFFFLQAMVASGTVFPNTSSFSFQMKKQKTGNLSPPRPSFFRSQSSLFSHVCVETHRFCVQDIFPFAGSFDNSIWYSYVLKCCLDFFVNLKLRGIVFTYMRGTVFTGWVGKKIRANFFPL